jgi:cytochrome bd ubiquinol oxidase subunit I
MDQVLLSRPQFALTIGYCILWRPFSIGITWFIVVLKTLWLRTGSYSLTTTSSPI